MSAAFFAFLASLAELHAPGLSSPHWRERELAYTELHRLLPASEGVLVRLSRYGDPEAARRADKLLAGLLARRDAAWATDALRPERARELPWLNDYTLTEGGWLEPEDWRRRRECLNKGALAHPDSGTPDWTAHREAARLFLLQESPSHARYLIGQWRRSEEQWRRWNNTGPAPWEVNK